MSDLNPSHADTGGVRVTLPRIPAHQWRLLLPLALLLLAAGVYWLQRSHDLSEHALRLAVVHQSELAARVSASATRAVGGEAGAFFEFRRSRIRSVAARTPLKFESSPLTQLKESDALRVKLDELNDLWRRVDDASERLLKAETATARVRKDVDAFQSIATGILVTADELVDAMVAADEPPAQVRAASRQLLLIQRISANIRRVLEGGEGMITAADRFGRDAVLFGEVNNALLVGSPEMKLKRVRNGPARELLVDVGREFRRSADLIEQVMSDAVALAGARTAAAVVVADTSRIS
ncbi:MAG: hypothetical protein OEM98_17980, partial [Gammaproteobacteria bacterium]|nr:hypothetical protein [Gammaproteobacteria bacterium]